MMSLRAAAFKMLKEMEENPRVNKSILKWLSSKPNPQAVMNLFISE
jgi:hypothetical protein